MAKGHEASLKCLINNVEELGTSISFYCDLECKTLSNDMICQALSLLRQHHPYFRLRADVIDGKLWLVEEGIGDIPLVWIEGVTQNWEDELVNFANESQDHAVSLTFLRCRYNGDGRYQLFGVVNHIALDGLGFIKALHTFFTYLGEMSQYTNYIDVPLADQRTFIDVFARNPKAQPPVFNFNHNYLPPQELDCDEEEIHSSVRSSKGKMIGLFKKFDSETTTKLLSYAKAQSVTIQGLLSTAALITSIWIRKLRHPLPIWALNWCATNLRQSAQPPIDPEDCVLASAPLAWEQQIDDDMAIWCIARNASEQLHKNNCHHMGWDFLNAKKFDVFVKPPSLMTSSIGKAQLGTQYGKLKVKDLRIMPAHYDCVRVDVSSHMNYACIYDGQLHVVTTFTNPGLSQQWGKRFHEGIIYIFECYANDSNLNVNTILKILDSKDKDQRVCSTPDSIATCLRTMPVFSWMFNIRYPKCIQQFRTIGGLTALSCCMLLLSFGSMAYLKRNLSKLL